jgi:hypothetical protein
MVTEPVATVATMACGDAALRVTLTEVLPNKALASRAQPRR